MYKKLAIFFLFLPLIAHAATVESLIKQADKLNDQCRGGSGDSPATIKACDMRDKLVDEIKAKGWCFGHEGQAGYQREWEKCVAPHKAVETETESRFPVGAGLVMIADGSYKVVILTNDSVGTTPNPTYCGSNWYVGLIQFAARSPKNAPINLTGCWTATSSNHEGSQILFRYMDMPSGKIMEFKKPSKQFSRYIYEWRTEKLFPGN